MNHVPSNFTPREELRVFGTLRPEVQETMVERLEFIEEAAGIGAHIDEAAGCYPAEDLLSEELATLHKLAGRLRGDNHDTLRAIIKSIEAVLDDVRKARTALDNAQL